MTEEAEQIEETTETPEAVDVPESTEEPVDADKPEDKPGKSKGIENRIDQLTKEKYDALREAQYWKDLANQKPPEPNQKEPEPIKTLADFDYDESEYIQYAINLAKEEARNDAVGTAQKALSDDQHQPLIESRECLDPGSLHSNPKPLWHNLTH